LAGFARALLAKQGAAPSVRDVEDVLQDAYLAAAEHLRHDVNLKIKNMPGWFRRVLFLTCLDHGDRTRRRRRRFIEGMFEQNDLLDLIAGQRVTFDLHVALIEALGSLLDEDRQIVEMSAAGHTSGEIAAYLGPDMTAEAVRKRKSRVLATLQKMLGGVKAWDH
jgi:RNA polymerase sigma factor (sigma-70 family)